MVRNLGGGYTEFHRMRKSYLSVSGWKKSGRNVTGCFGQLLFPHCLQVVVETSQVVCRIFLKHHPYDPNGFFVGRCVGIYFPGPFNDIKSFLAQRKGSSEKCSELL